MRIAILDLNDGKPNQGMRCITQLVQQFLDKPEYQGAYQIFEVRQENQVPDIQDFDIFISSGGPGSPYPAGLPWENKFDQFLDALYIHNQTQDNKKYAFLICHSFQLACYHWQLGNVSPRRSTSFGIMPVHKTVEGAIEPFFHGLSNPFFAVDSRDFQVIEPNDERLEQMGAKIVALEKFRPHVALERAVMAIRFSDEIFGTQFHPEADAPGMRYHFSLPEKKVAIIQKFGAEKYNQILNHLNDEDKITLTESVIIPTFLEMAAEGIHEQHLVSSF